MNLIIDGFNLMHATPELAFADATGEGLTALATALRLYRKKRRHKITLVLDGGPDPHGGRDTLEGVPVVWSGGRTADEVIVDMCANLGGGVTVVTDDRELTGLCAARGAQVVGSGQFGERLMAAAQGAGLFPADPDEEGWDFSTKKKGPSRRQPKLRRRKDKALDKL